MKLGLELGVTLGEWQKKAHAQAAKSGFHDGAPVVAAFVMNLVSEVAEAWEAYRGGKMNEPCDKAEKMVALGLPALTCMEEELADVMIRVFDTAETFGIDIDRAVAAKHAYNGTRTHKHGGKLA